MFFFNKIPFIQLPATDDFSSKKGTLVMSPKREENLTKSGTILQRFLQHSIKDLLTFDDYDKAWVENRVEKKRPTVL